MIGLSDLYYNPIDIAWIIFERDMSIKDAYGFVSKVWEIENAYISSQYRDNKRTFIIETMMKVSCLHNIDDFNSEISVINKEFEDVGKNVLIDKIDDYSNLNIFFKEVRLKIIILQSQNYVRIKFRTLLRKHGYKRRSEKLINMLKDKLSFYKINTYVRGGKKCDITKVDIDDIIIFKL